MTRLRKFAVLASAVFAIAASRFHEITGLGISVGEFSARSDKTITAAGFVFAVWALLYLGMLAFAVFHATKRGDQSLLAQRLAWPAAFAFFCCGAWVIAACLDIPWLTVILIVAPAGVLFHRLTGSAGADARAATRFDDWLALWPLAALAGWLTVAAGLNIVGAAERYGLIGDLAPPLPVAIVAVAVVTGLGLFVAARTRNLTYAVLVAWGLIGVSAAEYWPSPMLSIASSAGVVACVFGGFLLSRRAREVVQAT